MIKLTALVENTSSDDRFRSEHGLSIYIETEKHKLLFDLGQGGLFHENAEKMGIDVSAVDTVVISHGHYDHGGGLAAFLNANDKANIYIRENAFEKHLSRRETQLRDIGLDAGLLSLPRFVLTSHEHFIDDELRLFSGVTGRRLFSGANSTLLMEENGTAVCDSFSHEQDLIISDGDRDILVTGCSHNGIVNIIDRYRTLSADRTLACVVGGFHLFNPSSGKYESDELICQIADELNEAGSSFFTCHCTGVRAFELMKKKMGKKLGYFAVGDSIEF